MAVAYGIAREAVRDGVVFTVDVTHKRRVPTVSEAFTQVIAILKENAEVGTVAAPLTVVALNDEHGVQLKNQRPAHRVTNGTPKASAEAVEFGNIVGRRTRTQVGCERNRG